MALVSQQQLAKRNKGEQKVSLTTRTKRLLSTAIASLTLLTLTASPSLADTHQETVTPTKASSSTNEAQPTQQETSQITAPTNQTQQQQNQTGCGCCKNMMNNMQGMRNNMPGMMGDQTRDK
ncbi:MAG: hypothetical protein M3O33_10570 [Cyanobacteriota bacterium]|nr:hypothetical protein [Cyanobacteriota bacterium]